ncbi:TetR/AcrR family transcriptional regulator [Luteipulveratus mongoliensis]|uniref:TetR/AcrR family transcriptional regulator n=1 Tax=Luteipulveratus mongoliensis TaxID=571913 RepID=UPI00069601AC|nr:TetR/AcrR family transcriptional regulator [Luteipulveratus mongoliensis]
MAAESVRRPRRAYAARLPREQRREQLLDAALVIIDRDGYRAVSMDAIARECGVTRPVVYGVFDDLSDLLTGLLDREESRALTQLAEAAAGTPAADLEGYVTELARRMVSVVIANPLTWRPILFSSSIGPSVVRGRVERDREMVRLRIAEALALHLATSPGAELDSEVMAHAILAAVEHFGRLLLDDPERFDADRLVAALRGLLAAFQ